VRLHRAISPEHLEQRLTAALDRSTDSLYRIHIDQTHWSILGRRFRLAGLTITPDQARLKAHRRAGISDGTVYSISIPSFEAVGLDLAGLLKGRWAATRATVSGIHADAFLDRTAPAESPTHVAAIPHDWLASVKQALFVDTVVITGGSVRYSEKAVVGAEPGRITFDQVNATVFQVTNRPSEPGRRTTPLVLQARLAGGGRLDLTGDFDFTAKHLDFAYQGTVRHLDGQRLNATLLNLQGMRLRKGVLDSARFKVDVRRDTAVGRVTVIYHDLETEFRDRVTHKRGLKKKIKTFIANHLTLRTDNSADGDDPPKSVPVRLVRTPDMAFFEFVWKTLRQGLLLTVVGQGDRPNGGG
jgi:hypothetical protein